MSRLVALVAVLALAVACGIARDGKCRDYRPLSQCGLDSVERCERTKDGCEQCSCVPLDVRGRAPFP